MRPQDRPKQKGRDLFTPRHGHWYALTGTLSGTPDVGVPRMCPVSQNYQFCVGQQPKPQICDCFFGYIIRLSEQWRTDSNLVFRPPACTWRSAGEGELLFALIHSGPILPELVEGVNGQVLPVFWRFCPIAKTVGGRQRPSGQAMREKQRDSGANRAGGGQCRAKARLQTGLENNGSQSVSTFS